MSTSKAAGGSEEKKEELNVGRVRIVYKDVPESLEEFAINSATGAIKAFYKGEKGYYKDVAETVKAEFDQAYPGTWHVIVGKSFGSFVTHEVRRYIK